MFRSLLFRASAAVVAGCSIAAPIAASASTFTTLHAFAATDGLSPQGHLFYDYLNNAPVVIGAAQGGGANSAGTIFTYNLKNGSFATEAAFPGPPGAQTPVGGVAINLTNNRSLLGEIVGTSANGGTNNDGSVYTVSTSGIFSTAYSFGAVANANNPGSPLDGSSPFGVLAEGFDGNFYGTTALSGAGNSGTVFRFSPTSNTVTTIYTFGNNPAVLDGEDPLEGLTLAGNNVFYGTTSSGGAYGQGAVYSVTTTGTVKTIYSFTGANDGANPACLVSLDRNGNLYGTAPSGGQYGDGTLWELSPAGSITVLHAFTGAADGSAPTAGVAFTSKTAFYGTSTSGGASSAGTIFSYNLSSHAFATVHAFAPATDGSDPQSQLLIGPGGALFGTAESGGTNGYGTFFAFTP